MELAPLCNMAPINVSRMQDDIDPKLQRTVVVSTKLDTRLPQFGNASDVLKFISPTEHFASLSPLGGAPFFTSVPAKRVGGEKDGLNRFDTYSCTCMLR